MCEMHSTYTFVLSSFSTSTKIFVLILKNFYQLIFILIKFTSKLKNKLKKQRTMTTNHKQYINYIDWIEITNYCISLTIRNQIEFAFRLLLNDKYFNSFIIITFMTMSIVFWIDYDISFTYRKWKTNLKNI